MHSEDGWVGIIFKADPTLHRLMDLTRVGTASHGGCVLESVLLSLLVLASTSLLPIGSAQLSPQPNAFFTYRFEVDSDGFTRTTILVQSQGTSEGTTWLCLPKDTEVDSSLLSGRVQDSNRRRCETPGGQEYIFYYNYTLSYLPQGGLFNLSLAYDFPRGAFVSEPEAFFFSPQIAYPSFSSAEAILTFPTEAQISAADVFLNSGGTPADAQVETGGNGVRVSVTPSSTDRVAIQYEVSSDRDPITIERGRLSAEVPKRYESLANTFLDVYEEAMPVLDTVFGTELQDVKLVLFVPSREEFLSGVGGFVPFRGDEVGEVNINIFYVRTIEGFLEVVALHELVHHYTLSAGVPVERLWFHEGLAEYLSLEVGNSLGFEEAAEQRASAYDGASLSDLGFLQSWSPHEQVSNTFAHYAASYKVFKELGSRFGGLDFYESFFEETSDRDLSSDNDIVQGLGDAADRDLVPLFESWGFALQVESQLRTDLSSVRERIEDVNRIYQPYRWMGFSLLDMAESDLDNGRLTRAWVFLRMADLMATLALPLAALTYGILLALAFLLLSRAMEREDKAETPQAPTAEPPIPPG